MLWGSLFSVASLKIKGTEAIHCYQEEQYDCLVAVWILFSEVTPVSNIKCQGSGLYLLLQ